MRTILGQLLLTAYVTGTLAALANETWAFARLYATDERFRARADRFFSAPGPGLFGHAVRIITMALVGIGLLINALVWPGVQLFDLINRARARTAERRDDMDA